MASKNAIDSATVSDFSTRRTNPRDPPQKSPSLTRTFVTLQRPPPLTRIFAPGRRAPSTSTTRVDGFNRRVKIAVANPDAPAPMMTMGRGGGEVMAALSRVQADVAVAGLPPARAPRQKPEHDEGDPDDHPGLLVYAQESLP